MKILKTVLVLFLLSGCQESENEIIRIQETISNYDKQMIDEIEKKSEITYSDNIQLAVIYAEYDVDEHVIEDLISKSISLNKKAARETLNTLLRCGSKWAIVCNYDIVQKELAIDDGQQKKYINPHDL